VTYHTVGIHVENGNTALINGVPRHDTAVFTTGPGVTVQNIHTGDPAFALDGHHIAEASAAVDADVEAGVTDDIDSQPRPWDAVIYLPVVMR
jgi:hypothetical protein